MCHNERFTSIHKKWLTVFIWVFPVILSMLIYLLARCLNNKSIKLKAQVCTTRLITLSFIPVTTSLLELVHCIPIIQDDGVINVLFIEADDTLCPQWWQYIVYVLIGLLISFDILFLISNNPILYFGIFYI